MADVTNSNSSMDIDMHNDGTSDNIHQLVNRDNIDMLIDETSVEIPKVNVSKIETTNVDIDATPSEPDTIEISKNIKDDPELSQAEITELFKDDDADDENIEKSDDNTNWILNKQFIERVFRTKHSNINLMNYCKNLKLYYETKIKQVKAVMNNKQSDVAKNFVGDITIQNEQQQEISEMIRQDTILKNVENMEPMITEYYKNIGNNSATIMQQDYDARNKTIKYNLLMKEYQQNIEKLNPYIVDDNNVVDVNINNYDYASSWDDTERFNVDDDVGDEDTDIAGGGPTHSYSDLISHFNAIGSDIITNPMLAVQMSYLLHKLQMAYINPSIVKTGYFGLTEINNTISMLKLRLTPNMTGGIGAGIRVISEYYDPNDSPFDRSDGYEDNIDIQLESESLDDAWESLEAINIELHKPKIKHDLIQHLTPMLNKIKKNISIQTPVDILDINDAIKMIDNRDPRFNAKTKYQDARNYISARINTNSSTNAPITNPTSGETTQNVPLSATPNNPDIISENHGTDRVVQRDVDNHGYTTMVDTKMSGHASNFFSANAPITNSTPGETTQYVHPSATLNNSDTISENHGTDSVAHASNDSRNKSGENGLVNTTDSPKNIIPTSETTLPQTANSPPNANDVQTPIQAFERILKTNNEANKKYLAEYEKLSKLTQEYETEIDKINKERDNLGDAQKKIAEITETAVKNITDSSAKCVSIYNDRVLSLEKDLATELAYNAEVNKTIDAITAAEKLDQESLDADIKESDSFYNKNKLITNDINKNVVKSDGTYGIANSKKDSYIFNNITNNYVKNNLYEFIESCKKLDSVPEWRAKISKLIVSYLTSYIKDPNISDKYVTIIPSYDIFNIVLMGTPGVGKSYTSEEVGHALKWSGFLTSGELKSIKKPDIIGAYTGQTAPKVYYELTQALGKVVFIDEAYSIAGPKDQTKLTFNDFGQEALDAITDYTSEHIGFFAFIVAGYEYEMKTQFLEVNIGLPRRFPTQIILRRYDLKSFWRILKNSISKFLPKFQVDNHHKACFELLNLMFNYQCPPNPLIKLSKNWNNMWKGSPLRNVKINLNVSNVTIPIMELLNFQDKLNADTPPSSDDVIILPYKFIGGASPVAATFIKSYIMYQFANITNGDFFRSQADNLTKFGQTILEDEIINPTGTFKEIENVNEHGNQSWTEYLYFNLYFTKNPNKKTSNIEYEMQPISGPNATELSTPVKTKYPSKFNKFGEEYGLEKYDNPSHSFFEPPVSNPRFGGKTHKSTKRCKNKKNKVTKRNKYKQFGGNTSYDKFIKYASDILKTPDALWENQEDFNNMNQLGNELIAINLSADERVKYITLLANMGSQLAQVIEANPPLKDAKYKIWMIYYIMSTLYTQLNRESIATTEVPVNAEVPKSAVTEPVQLTDTKTIVNIDDSTPPLITKTQDTDKTKVTEPDQSQSQVQVQVPEPDVPEPDQSQVQVQVPEPDQSQVQVQVPVITPEVEVPVIKSEVAESVALEQKPTNLSSDLVFNILISSISVVKIVSEIIKHNAGDKDETARLNQIFANYLEKANKYQNITDNQECIDVIYVYILLECYYIADIQSNIPLAKFDKDSWWFFTNTDFTNIKDGLNIETILKKFDDTHPQETPAVSPQETPAVSQQETQAVSPQETQAVSPQETQAVSPQENNKQGGKIRRKSNRFKKYCNVTEKKR
jgi:hypothetical protein